MTTSSQEQTVNIPQLLLVLVISGFAIRYFFFSPAASSATNGASNNNASTNSRQRAISNGVRAREADVERIQQMFPQIDRRSIMWNLQRDGGNVSATAERVLSGRGLEVPPISFQPPLPAASSSTPTTSSTSTTKSATASQPDLITRYNLSSKLKTNLDGTESRDPTPPDLDSTIATAGARQAWSANKGERQALLQRRREEMILNARKKMEAKVAAERDGASTSSGNTGS